MPGAGHPSPSALHPLPNPAHFNVFLTFISCQLFHVLPTSISLSLSYLAHFHILPRMPPTTSYAPWSCATTDLHWRWGMHWGGCWWGPLLPQAPAVQVHPSPAPAKLPRPAHHAPGLHLPQTTAPLRWLHSYCSSSRHSTTWACSRGSKSSSGKGREGVGG